jgi:hypothetical protein
MSMLVRSRASRSSLRNIATYFVRTEEAVTDEEVLDRFERIERLLDELTTRTRAP